MEVDDSTLEAVHTKQLKIGMDLGDEGLDLSGLRVVAPPDAGHGTGRMV